MADCLNNEEQINSNLSESNVDALTSNLDGASSVTSEMGVESSISSTMYSTDTTTSNLGSEEPLNSELDLPTTYTYRGSETDNIVVTVDNKGFIISASVKQIKFNSVSDFPEVGSEHLIYIDATNKALYGWDANSGYYKLVADVKVPTKLSEFENDGDGKSPFATVDYVNQNAGGESYDDTEIRQSIADLETNKVSRVTDTAPRYRFYGIAYNSTADKIFEGYPGSTTKQWLAMYNSGGTLTVKTPTGENHATNKEYVDNLVSTIPKFSVEVVTSLPTENISTTTVYLVSSGSGEQNLYVEYIYVNGTWEKLGEQTIDLSNYPTIEEMNTAIADYLSNYYTSEQVDGFISTLNKDITDLNEGKADKSEIPELYNETGQNTDGSMTQKAVTDELNNIKNNKTLIVAPNYGFAGGLDAFTNSGGAIGSNSMTDAGGAVGASSYSYRGFAGGGGATTGDGVAIGFLARTYKQTNGSSVESSDAIQLGTGINYKEKSLQVYDDNIYDSNTHTLTVENIKLKGEDINNLLGAGGTKIIWEVWE